MFGSKELNEIHNHFLLYFGDQKRSFIRIHDFLQGYNLHRCEEMHVPFIANPLLPGFSEFICEYYNIAYGKERWSDTVLRMSGSDEDAYDAFFKLIQLYEAIPAIKKDSFYLFIKTQRLLDSYNHFMPLYTAILMQYPWIADPYVSCPDEECSFREFGLFIKTRLNDHSERAWPELIRTYETDKEDALSLFYRLFDEYVNYMIHIQSVQSGDQNNQGQSGDGSKPLKKSLK